MSDTTTIKVPRLLRDRLAERAKRDHLPLAQVIEQALDENEDRAFWTQVRADHVLLGKSERAGYADNSARRDDLADAADDELSDNNGW